MVKRLKWWLGDKLGLVRYVPVMVPTEGYVSGVSLVQLPAGWYHVSYDLKSDTFFDGPLAPDVIADDLPSGPNPGIDNPSFEVDTEGWSGRVEYDDDGTQAVGD